MTIKQRFGQMIREYRKTQGLLQRELSDRLNYSQSMVSRLERGCDFISQSTYEKVLKRIGLAFHIDETHHQAVEKLIQRFTEAVIELDYKTTEDILNAFSPYKSNPFFYYDFLVVQLYHFYFSGDNEQTLVTLALLTQKAYMVHPYLRPYLDMLTFIYQKKESISVQEEQALAIPVMPHEGLQIFLHAINDYYDHYHTKALNGFLRAMTLFRRYTHERWQAHCEVFINKILMTDNDYGNLKVRTQALLRKNKDYLPRDTNCLSFQLAYSLYHLNALEEAYQILLGLQGKTFEYEDLVPYMIDKCCLKLQKQPTLNSSNHNHTLHVLYQHYEQDEKNPSYYHLIEQVIVPDLPRRLEINEYLTYAFDLLDYYGNKGNYQKYQELSQKMNILYRLI